MQFKVTFIVCLFAGWRTFEDDRGPDEDRGGEAKAETARRETNERRTKNYSRKGKCKTKTFLLADCSQFVALKSQEIFVL